MPSPGPPSQVRGERKRRGEKAGRQRAAVPIKMLTLTDPSYTTSRFIDGLRVGRTSSYDMI